MSSKNRQQDAAEAKKDIINKRNEVKRDQESLRKAFNDKGNLSRGWMREILDTDDLEDRLQENTIKKIQGMINKQWMLGNLSPAEVHDRVYKLEVMKIKIKGEHPPPESAIVGPMRAVVYDDEIEDLMPLSSQERNTIDQIIVTLQNMVTRSRDGFEREQINTSIARTENDTDSDSSRESGFSGFFSN